MNSEREMYRRAIAEIAGDLDDLEALRHLYRFARHVKNDLDRPLDITITENGHKALEEMEAAQ